MQKKPPKPSRPFWRQSTSSDKMGQPPKAPETEPHTETDNTPQEIERDESQAQVMKSQSETDEQAANEEIKETFPEEEKEVKERVPIKGDLKWEKEKKPIRSSTRTHKKPNWLDNNVVVTNVEQEASAGESLPSVFEIAAPTNN